jgi:hypothetical protein
MESKGAAGQRIYEILGEWGNALKLLDDSQDDPKLDLLLECVKTLDKLAHAILSGEIQESTQHTNSAVHAMIGWARVAESFDEAPLKAEKIFEALQFDYGDRRDLWRNLVQRRQDLYFAIFWAWSRSKLKNAPEGALRWLHRMKEEQSKLPWKYLLSSESYNRVMDTLCNHVHRNDVVQQVRNLEGSHLMPLRRSKVFC